MIKVSPQENSLLSALFSRRGGKAWFATGMSFLGLDLLWLGMIGRPIYDRLLGDLLRPQAYVPAAILFYVFFVTTVVGYGVLGARSSREAMGRGGALGFVTYTTYELTNWAVIVGWPGLLVPMDITWGVFLTALASVTGYKASSLPAGSESRSRETTQ